MRPIDFFDRAAIRHPKRAFVVDRVQAFTHDSAREWSWRFAGAFVGLGFGPGTRVAVCSENSSIACLCILGILRADFVWITVGANSAHQEIADALTCTQAAVVLVSSRYASTIDAIERCDSVRLIIEIDDFGGRHPSLSDILKTAATRPPAFRAEPNSVATILSTSGTSGTPKGIAHANRAWELLAANSRMNLGCEPAISLVAAPLTQTAGAGGFLSDLSAGTTRVLVDFFDPCRILEMIESERISRVFMPPAAMKMLLSHPRIGQFSLSSLRHFIYGGAPISADTVAEAMEVFGPVLTTGFAQTETGGPVTFLSPREHSNAIATHQTALLGSCGRETFFSTVRIVDDSGSPLPAGTEGEIAIRSSHLMCGRYLGPNSEYEAWTDEWHRTGDIGRVDEGGYLFVVDRKTDMIITRGINVYPAEIERVLESQSGVRACAVVGVPHDTMGEVVVAVIEIDEHREVSTSNVMAACRARLSSHKVPVSIESWPELPKSEAGKVLRRVVRDHFWTGAGRSI